MPVSEGLAKAIYVSCIAITVGCGLFLTACVYMMYLSIRERWLRQ